MSFHNWYAKSIEEAQARYKKEEKAKAKKEIDDYEDVLYDMNYGSVDIVKADDTIEEDLLRLDDDGGWLGI